jgi:RHS repeat-associated protein
VTIPNGSSSTTLTLTPIDDCRYEYAPGGEFVSISIIDGAGYQPGSSSGASLLITDNDTYPTVSIGDWTGAEPSQDTPVPFAVNLSLSCESNLTTTVHYKTEDGTATVEDYDYIGVIDNVLTIAPGQLSATAHVTVKHDVKDEEDEAFNIVLFSPQNASLGDSTGTGTINNNDTANRPSVSINDVTVEENAGLASFAVTLSVESGKTVTVQYETQNGTASAPGDFESKIGTLTFAPGETSKPVTVTIVDDSDPENHESFSVVLSSPSNASLGDSTGTGTIKPEKPKVKIEATQPNAFESGATAGAFKITRFGEIAYTFSLTIDAFPHFASTADEDIDYVFDGMNSYEGSVLYTVTIPAGHAYTSLIVSPIDDADSDEDDFESVIVSIGNSSNDYSIAPGYESATVWIEDNDRESHQESDENDGECQDTCCRLLRQLASGCAISPASGDPTTSAAGHSTSPMDSPGEMSEAALIYDSRSNPHPIISVDVTFDAAALTATSIEAQLTYGGITSAPVYYDPATLVAGTSYRFALMADAALPTGSYHWQMRIAEHYNGQASKIRDYTGRHEIANRTDSEFGNRWAHTQVDRVDVVDANVGVTLVEGSGSVSFFRTSALYEDRMEFEREKGEPGYSTLIADFGTNTFILRNKTGVSAVFNGNNGLIMSRFDQAGNETRYHYIDANGDFFFRELARIEDPSGLNTIYGYEGGKVRTITDFAGRVTTLDYHDGRLVKVTQPDPDGTGPLLPPISEFNYEASTGLLNWYKDPDGKITTLQYRPDRTVKRRTHHDGTYEEFASSLNAGVVDTSAGLGTQSQPAPLLKTTDVQGYHQDERDKLSYFKSDRFGATTWEKDAVGNETTYQRDSEGRVTKITGPDPDGPEPAPVTEYTYDSLGNVTFTKHPDGSTESWTYTTGFSHPTSHTDRRGKLTKYTLDPDTGLVEEVRQVIGQVDDFVNYETDDLVTTFTHTPLPTHADQPPAGLVKSITDPLGRITWHDYDTYGRLISVTYASGTSDSGTIEYEYDSAGNVSAFIDEVGRRTDYEYDSLNRLVKMTLPDPGNGSHPRPVYRYEYNNRGLRTKEIDPLERVTTYIYTDRGDLKEIHRPDHDDDGQLTKTIFGYDPARRLTSLADPLGRVTNYVPDDIGRIEETILPDPDGAGTEYVAPHYRTEYDQLSRIRQSINPRASHNTTDYAYVNFGRQVTATLPDPDGVSPSTDRPAGTVIYDAAGNITSSIDARGAVTTYTYDDVGRLATMREPNPVNGSATGGPLWLYSYDKAGNLRYVTDPRGNTTEHQYDNRNRLKKTIQPDPDGPGIENPLQSPIWQYSYHADGRLAAVTDPLGRVTAYNYDGVGRLFTVDEPDPDGPAPYGLLLAPRTIYTYDAAGRLTTVEDRWANLMNEPWGTVTEYEYDDLDNIMTVTQPDPDGIIGPLQSPVTQSVYDAAGQLKEMTDPGGRVTTYEYDNLGRLTKTTQPDPDGADPLPRPFTTYTYDEVGNLKSVTDPDPDGPGGVNPAVTTYEFDNLDRRTKIIDPKQGQTRFTYDAANNLKTLIDPVSNTTAWEYDFLGRAIAETNQLDKTRTFAYDAAGNLTQRIDRLNRKIVYAYDNLNRNTAEKWYTSAEVLVRTISFQYDAAGQLIDVSDPAAGYDYEYDGLGRVTQQRQTIAGLESHWPNDFIQYDRTYDLAGNLAVLEGWDFVNTNSYDNLHRLTRLTQEGAPGVTSVAEKRADFTYDQSGLVTQIDRYADLDTAEHVVSSHYNYDGLGRLTKLTHNDVPLPLPLGEGWGEGILAGYQYAYDRASRITSINSYLDGQSSYTYDLTSQLTGANHDQTIEPDLTDESYSYDANGNRTQTHLGNTIVESNNRLISDGIYNYAYDHEGNRTGRMHIATGLITLYNWDHRNRLTNVTDTSPPADEQSGAGTDWGWGSTSGGSGARMEINLGDPGIVSAQGSTWVTNGGSANTYSCGTGGLNWSISATVPPEGGMATVSLANWGSEEIDVSFWTEGENASGLSGGAHLMPSGQEGSSASFEFELTPDATFDGTVYFNLVADDGVSGPTSCGLAMDDNLGQASFEVRANNASEGSSLEVWLASHDPLLPNGGYQYSTADGSAIAGVDYMSISGTLSGGVSTLNDGDIDGDKSFLIHISHPDYPQLSLTLSPTILDNDRDVSFDAVVQPAVEGDDVLLSVSVNEAVGLEYLAEDVSAQAGIDYTDPGASGGVNWVFIDPSNQVFFGNIENTLDEAIRSFKVRVRLAGYPETEVVLEADILDDDVPGVLQSVDYAYDAFNQLVRRTIDEDGQGPGGTRDTFYSHQDGQIQLQFDFFAGPEYLDLSYRYLWNPAAVDQLLAAEEIIYEPWHLPPTSEVLWPLADHLGTLRDIVEYDAATDTTTRVNHRIYDSFGNLKGETNAAVDLIFGFTGRYYDEATKLQNNLNRWYDPFTGQWLSHDPIGFTAGDANLARYVSNNPLHFIDPSGLIGDGHHYVNQANWGGMSAAARAVFDSPAGRIHNNWYKGHNFSRVNGYTHDQYNDAVNKALDDYLDGRSRSRMTAKDAIDFLEDIKCSEDSVISEFNKGVRAEANEAAKAGKKAADAATRAGKSANQASEIGKKAAKDAVDKTRKRLNDAAAKRAQKAAAKSGGKSIGKRIWNRIPIVSGLTSGAAAWWGTGNWRAGGQALARDLYGVDEAMAAGELLAEGYDFAEADKDAAAQSVRDNFWHVP